MHINNNRGAKTLLTEGIQERFRQDFSKLTMLIEPCQVSAALRLAVDQDKLNKIKLVRIERANDRANQSTGKWVHGDADARLELEIGRMRNGRHLIPGPIKRFLGGDNQLFGEIVEFQGMTFDEVKVEVELPNGKQRTFNLQNPESGHPITEELTTPPLQFHDGDPTEGSLFAALSEILEAVTG